MREIALLNKQHKYTENSTSNYRKSKELLTLEGLYDDKNLIPKEFHFFMIDRPIVFEDRTLKGLKEAMLAYVELTDGVSLYYLFDEYLVVINNNTIPISFIQDSRGTFIPDFATFFTLINDKLDGEG